MQHLVIADDLHAPTLDRFKKNTIRSGRRDILPGKLELRAAGGTLPPITVDVIEVSHKLANQVTDDELFLNGFWNLDDMLEGMRRFYPDFGPRSEVTVVEWS